MGDDHEMNEFATSDGQSIAYRTWGPLDDGPPVVLHHGFVADSQSNWVGPGIVDALVDGGRSVIALDARGHGRSAKPHDPALYGEGRMAQDLGELIDHLGVASFQLAGYSMGAIVSLVVAATDDRIERLVVGGIGRAAVEMGGVDRDSLDIDELIPALEAESADDLEPGIAQNFRLFAEASGADRLALAAQARSVHRTPIPFDRITVPTLVIAGDKDPLARHPEILRDAIAGADLAIIPGDHLGAVGQPEFTAALIDFLG